MASSLDVQTQRRCSVRDVVPENAAEALGIMSVRQFPGARQMEVVQA